MSVNKLQALDLNIKALYKEIRGEVEDSLKGEIYDITPTTGAVANILTLTGAPGMREFKSERRPGVVDNVVTQITPRKWEATLDVKAEQVEDDELGWVPGALRKMVNNSRRHYGRLASSALVKGFTSTLLDGKTFFDASRGNLQSGALTAANFDAAMLKLESQTDSAGEPMGFTPTTLVVGPQNRAAAKQILKAITINGGDSNTNFDAVALVVNPYIRDNSWYLVDNSQGALPITIAERVKTGAPISKDDLNSDRAFDKDIFSWGLRGRYDAAYANPNLIVGSTGQ